MERYFAFLRAINVGGRNVTMAALRDHIQALGLARVQSFIASGNLIFEAEAQATAALEKAIEEHLARVLGFEVATFVLTGDELADILKFSAFDDEQLAEAEALNIALLKAPLPADAMARVQALETEMDSFATHGRAFYWLCRQKQSHSTFNNNRFERTARAQATFRGINSLTRLARKYDLLKASS